MKTTLVKTMVTMVAVLMAVPAFAQDGLLSRDTLSRIGDLTIRPELQIQPGVLDNLRVRPQLEQINPGILDQLQIRPDIQLPGPGILDDLTIRPDIPNLLPPALPPQIPPQLPPLGPIQPVPPVGPPVVGPPLVGPQVVPALPATCAFIAKLQITGRIIPGVGMQVVTVQYGGAAFNIGLEPGDIIVQMDGRRIMSRYDYDMAMYNAAVFGGGDVDLVIRNVRYRPGCTINPMYVSRRAFLQRALTYPMAGPFGL
ncbi:MAG: PDZ domain-containing protein [Planctomycetota bacterium]